jgi:amino acid permease
VSTHPVDRRIRSVHCRELGRTIVCIVILVSHAITFLNRLVILNQYDRDIPLVLAAYLIWKLWKKTKILALSDIPLEEAFKQAEQAPDDEPPVKKNSKLRLVSWIWD